MARRAKERDRLMALAIFRHAGLKLLSIVLAALMWLLVAGERIVERSMRIPLEFTNLSDQLELVGETPTVVDVRVRGSSGALNRVTAGELVAMIDLSSARQGQRLFNVRGSDVRTPFGVEVVQVSPSSLPMRFERSASKVVRIVPAVDGQPADGFATGRATSDPSTVEIVGPESAVRSLTEATTEPVSVEDASEDVVETVTVGVADPAVRLREPLNARVTVSVAAVSVEWSVNVAVQVHNAARGGAETSPPRVTVQARGPQGAAMPDPDAFTVSVDVGGLRRGQYELPVTVVPPAGVGVMRVEPATLLVRVR